MIKKLMSMSIVGIVLLLSYFAVSCSKDIEPQLDINLALLNVAAAKSTASIAVTSNTNWTVSSSENWVKISPAAGSNDGTISINVDQNPDSTARKALLTIAANDLESQTVTVSQSGAMAISTTVLAFAAEENSTASFTITSDTSWTVSSSESWLSVEPAAGSKNGTVTVKAEKNVDTMERVTSLMVTEAGSTPQAIAITQSGMEYNLKLSTKAIYLAPEVNSTDTFTIITNAPWTITTNDSWLTVNPTSGEGKQLITISANEALVVGTPRFLYLDVTSDVVKMQRMRVTQNGVPCSSEDETACEVSGCPLPAMPDYSSLPDNPYLPDPFTFMDGTPVTTKAQWVCRRAEIAALAMEFEYGYKPCTPPSATTGKFNGNSITVTVSDNGKEISFDCSIIYPSTGNGPYPAMVGIGFSTIDNALLDELGVAIIAFPNDQIAEQANSGSRGKGKFYDFFCKEQTSGALMAWAWGVSRLIDAIEVTPEANLDPERIGVTGCSRNGKGALCVGAFDERIVLTIPQEPGSGGSASWRVSDDMFKQGQGTQTLQQIVGENCWFANDFSRFRLSATKLPFDQHMVEGLIAPRALLVLDNDILWLGPESGWNCANAARTIWDALGITDRMGYSGTTGHGHCSFPTSQQPELRAFVKKFLVGDGTDNTNIMINEPGYEFDQEKWINWSVPNLD